MTEADEDRTGLAGGEEEEEGPYGLLSPQHPSHPAHHTPRPLSGAEAYHRFLWHNKHVLVELKLSVMVVVGGVIVLCCVIYIVLQCRAKLRAAPNKAHNKRREDEKELFGSTETLENLIPAENSIRLKIRRDNEFFV